ncbi:hypothetical protein SESBI_21722 [Sesbania bispinosa]|nr:hypothetical protein SESBI_21722 [Sesbania bispinosa]
MKLHALLTQITNLFLIPRFSSHRKLVHGELSGALDEKADASWPLKQKTRANKIGEVSKESDGQSTRNDAPPQPHDEPTVQQSGPSTRVSACTAPKTHVPAVLTHAEQQVPLDLASLPMRASGPLITNRRATALWAKSPTQLLVKARPTKHTLSHTMQRYTDPDRWLKTQSVCHFFPSLRMLLAPLDLLNSPQMQFQPSSENTIRVKESQSTNLVDKVFI